MPTEEQELATTLNAVTWQVRAIHEQLRAVIDAVRENQDTLKATVGELEATVRGSGERLDKLEELEIAKAQK